MFHYTVFNLLGAQSCLTPSGPMDCSLPGPSVPGILQAILHARKLVAQMIKNLSAVQETQVQSLGHKDPLEKGMATHSSNLCLENPMDREAWWVAVH